MLGRENFLHFEIVLGSIRRMRVKDVVRSLLGRDFLLKREVDARVRKG